MSDGSNIRAFMHEVREKADKITASPHIGADVKGVIKDLIKIGENFENVLQQSSGQSADSRVLKKKLDQAKQDMRGNETKLETVKTSIMAIIEELKIVGQESNALLKRFEANSPDAIQVTRIKTSTQKMAETVVQLTKLLT